MGARGSKDFQRDHIRGAGHIICNGRWNVLEGEAGDGNAVVQQNVHIAMIAVEWEALAGSHCWTQQLLRQRDRVYSVWKVKHSGSDSHTLACGPGAESLPSTKTYAICQCVIALLESRATTSVTLAVDSYCYFICLYWSSLLVGDSSVQEADTVGP